MSWAGSAYIPDRAVDAANELYFVAANGDYNQAAAQYDLAGNQISLGQGGETGAVETEKYDAWDRLVEVDDASGHPIETFTYDGTGRRVSASAYSGGAVPVDHLLLPRRPTGDRDRVRQCERRLHGRLPVRLVAALHRRPDLPRHGGR